MKQFSQPFEFHSVSNMIADSVLMPLSGESSLFGRVSNFKNLKTVQLFSFAHFWATYLLTNTQDVPSPTLHARDIDYVITPTIGFQTYSCQNAVIGQSGGSKKNVFHSQAQR